jgi:hypothetical protein
MEHMDDDDLAIGAEAISRDVFKEKLRPRQVYRLLETEAEAWGAFKILDKWAMRIGRARAELARREGAPALKRTR